MCILLLFRWFLVDHVWDVLAACHLWIVEIWCVLSTSVLVCIMITSRRIIVDIINGSLKATPVDNLILAWILPRPDYRRLRFTLQQVIEQISLTSSLALIGLYVLVPGTVAVVWRCSIIGIGVLSSDLCVRCCLHASLASNHAPSTTLSERPSTEGEWYILIRSALQCAVLILTHKIVALEMTILRNDISIRVLPFLGVREV